MYVRGVGVCACKYVRKFQQGLHMDIAEHHVFHPIHHWTGNLAWRKDGVCFRTEQVASAQDIIDTGVGVSQSWVSSSSEKCTDRLTMHVQEGSAIDLLISHLGFPSIVGMSLDEYSIPSKLSKRRVSRNTGFGLGCVSTEGSARLAPKSAAARVLAIVAERNYMLIGDDLRLVPVCKGAVSLERFGEAVHINAILRCARSRIPLLLRHVPLYVALAACANVMWQVHACSRRRGTLPRVGTPQQDSDVYLSMALAVTPYEVQSARAAIRANSDLEPSRFDSMLALHATHM